MRRTNGNRTARAVLIAVTALTVLVGMAPSAHAVLSLLQAFTQGEGARPGSAEILSYSSDENTVASTMSGAGNFGVQLLSLSTTGQLSERGIATFNMAFGGSAPGAVSSTALDPLKRGFGAVALIPTDNGTTQGKVGFYDYRAGTPDASRPLVTIDVGFHPDSIKFSDDGSKLYVANEGEFTTGGATDAPGSISIIDLSSIAAIGDVAGLTSANVTDIDFQAANLGPGVSITGLRYTDEDARNDDNIKYRHVEPEYLSVKGNQVFVSLQENNALAVLDVDMGNPANSQYTAIHYLGTITNTIDASDRDGPGNSGAALIDDPVKGLPMPDGIASFMIGGTTYIVTANEGDFRVDDGDRARVKDYMGTEGGLMIDMTDDGLGRLRISTFDSDPDGNGFLNDIIMPGTRSFSIWNADTGELVSDTGSLEPLLLALDPLLHNINAEDGLGTFDDRSDDKGPEPEGVDVAELFGRRFAFVGMERQDGILMFDISDPAHPFFIDYINSGIDGLIAPESLVVIPATDSPTGGALLLVGYEQSGGGIGVYSIAIPEPVSAAMLLIGCGAVMMRRRRVAR